MLPGIFALLLLVVTSNLSSMAVVREREVGTLEQLNVTPLGRMQLIFGKLLPYAAIGMIDAVIVLAVIVFWFHVPLRGSFWLLIAMSLVYLMTTLGLGLFISTISNTQQQAMMTSTFFFMTPMMYLSGFVFPIENMPVVDSAADVPDSAPILRHHSSRDLPERRGPRDALAAGPRPVRLGAWSSSPGRTPIQQATGVTCQHPPADRRGDLHPSMRVCVARPRRTTSCPSVLEGQAGDVERAMRTYIPAREQFRYADGKYWSVRELLGHVTPTPNACLASARSASAANDEPLPGFMTTTSPAQTSIAAVLQILFRNSAVRRVGTAVCRRWTRRRVAAAMGAASDKPVSVRATAYVMASHVRHHLDIPEDALSMTDITQAFLQKSSQLARLGFSAPGRSAASIHLTDEDVWRRPNEASNSIGACSCIFCGNMTQWIIGGVAGQTLKAAPPGEFDGRTGSRLRNCSRCAQSSKKPTNHSPPRRRRSSEPAPNTGLRRHGARGDLSRGGALRHAHRARSSF